MKWVRESFHLLRLSGSPKLELPQFSLFLVPSSLYKVTAVRHAAAAI